jgi:hypothetical protein
MGELIEKLVPSLKGKAYTITSPEARTYNCVAWALGETTDWWWPGDPGCTFWPAGIPREETPGGVP